FGANTDLLSNDERYIGELPDGWEMEDGAGLLEQAITAYCARVVVGRMPEREAVLIHAAAGGVGLQANRIAKQLGAYTIGSVGSPAKVELLRDEGYDAWIVRSAGFRKDLERALNGRPLNIVLECIGGHILMDGF